MSDILSIGAGATQLYRQSLATVSNNIANLNTEGYSRQVTTSAEGMPSQQGTVYIGTGARLDNITRAYDEFIESSLRNSTSELSTQQPMIEYANRIVDLMGSQTSGLSSAMDKFFATASDLSADPASTIQRNMFLRDADGLASRFREIAGHFGAIEQETRSGIELEVKTVNTLSQQLVTVNTQLGKKISLDKQPSALLDQRDRLLRDLSALSKIHVFESATGAVDVRLGSSSGSMLVNGRQSFDLGVSFDPNEPGRVDIVIDPYGDPRAASTVGSGSLGGLINFRSQTLGSAMNSFDYLAQTVVQEVNQIHTSGLDARGERGGELFRIDSVFEVNSPTVNSNVSIEVEVIDPEAFKFAPFEIRWGAESRQWRIEDMQTGEIKFSPPNATNFEYAGLNIASLGNARDGDTFFINPISRPAAGFRMVQSDPLAIAAASRMRAMASDQNIGESRVSLEFAQKSVLQGFEFGQDIYDLGNNSSSAAGVAIDPSSLKPALVIPQGAENVELMMEVPINSNLRFQVMTQEGVHILGHSIDTDTQNALMTTDSGFVAGSSYSSTYLNTTGADAYHDLDMTYGFLARGSERQEYVPNADGSGVSSMTTTIDAQVKTDAIVFQDNPSMVDLELIAQDALILNDVSLSQLTLAAGDSSSASAIAAWLNTESSATGVTVTASNSIEASAEEINLLEQIRINGVLIGNGSLPANIDSLATAINAETSTTNVSAYVSREGGIIITNAVGHEGENISLSNPDASATSNTLGQPNQTFTGSLQLHGTEQVRFTFGASGVPADLSVLGLRTGIFINGAATEELAVFVTGDNSANIAPGFNRPQTPVTENSESPFTVDFLSATQYTITDTVTGTVVATRNYAAGDQINYQSLSLSFNTPPTAGDHFEVDGNEAGIGDNSNMLLIVALQDKPVLRGGRSISDGYIDIVGSVGNKATLGKISQEALQVVYDQAVSSRDQVSGVSLDQEAADLIRFQQAYQASAQIIQMSSKIFDSILAIR
jgi:flagellar hook-associated protein FlgK